MEATVMQENIYRLPLVWFSFVSKLRWQ